MNLLKIMFHLKYVHFWISWVINTIILNCLMILKALLLFKQFYNITQSIILDFYINHLGKYHKYN
jgi:hypothetical protein